MSGYLIFMLRRRWNPADAGQQLFGFDALIHGHLSAVYPAATSMTSPPGFLLLAAPIVAALGGDLVNQATECSVGMLSGGFLALCALRLARSLRPGAHPLMVRLTAAALLVAAPFTGGLVDLFHPEDLVAVGFVLLAIDATAGRRPHRAGLALAAGLLTRQWVVLAAVPLLLAAGTPGGGRRQMVRAAAGLCAVALGPFLLLDGRGLLQALAAKSTGLSPDTIWFHLSLPPDRAFTLARVAPLVCCVPTALALRRRWRGAAPGLEPLLGGCLLCLTLRMAFETECFAYYFVPMVSLLLVLSLGSADRRRRVEALAGVAAIQVLLSIVSLDLPRGTVAVALLFEGTVLACGLLAWRATAAPVARDGGLVGQKGPMGSAWDRSGRTFLLRPAIIHSRRPEVSWTGRPPANPDVGIESAEA